MWGGYILKVVKTKPSSSFQIFFHRKLWNSSTWRFKQLFNLVLTKMDALGGNWDAARSLYHYPIFLKNKIYSNDGMIYCVIRACVLLIWKYLKGTDHIKSFKFSNLQFCVKNIKYIQTIRKIYNIYSFTISIPLNRSFKF